MTAWFIEFESRLNIACDLQECTDPVGGGWRSIRLWIDGASGPKQHDEPVEGKRRAFYRIVEFR